ncbi:MAG: hypothetical protein K8S97_16945 [Anaerolineae bacterium]|nr:hypothetical protein [Anaerolineae bacterium]
MRRKRPSRRRARKRDQNHEQTNNRQMATPAEIEAAYHTVADDTDTDSPVDDAQIAADAFDNDASDDYNVDEFDAFVPVGPGAHEAYAVDDEPDDDMAAADDHTPRRRRLSRPALDMALRGDVLLVALALIAAGIFGTLLVRGDVRAEVRDWWPVALVATTIVWMLGALLRRHVASFLGAAAFAGVGLSLLMDTQDIANVEETLLGVVLITAGLGIAVRGLLLRQRTAYR